MKANEAPENIYVSQHSGLHFYKKNNEDDIEYTRTDAFIERVYEFLKNYAFTDDENKVHLPTLLHDFLKDVRNL